MKIVISLYILLLSLRYRVKLKGVEVLQSESPKLFLPNHQAIVDPQILFTQISRYTPVVPITTETYFKIPVLKQTLHFINAVPVSDLTAGSRDTQVLQKILDNVNKTINNNKSVLLYPSGQIAEQGFEKIKNKKSAWTVVSDLPCNTKIIGVRISGLWGSMWSKANTGKSPDFFKTLLKGIFIVFANFIFFVPKRRVSIEFCDITLEAKQRAKKGRIVFNNFLEEFYNKNGEDEMRIVKHYFLK